MRKKIIGMAALVLTLSMVLGMSAFAMRSVSTTNSSVTIQVMKAYAREVQAWFTKDGKAIPVVAETIENYDDAVIAAAGLIPGGQVMGVVDLRLYDHETLEGGVTVKAPRIAQGRSYAFVYRVGDTWKAVDAVVNADGTLSAVFGADVPVVLAIVEKAGGASSPKTGQNSDLYTVLAMTAFCGLAAVSFKKAREI